MPPPPSDPDDAKPQLGTAALPLTKVVGATDFFCGLAKTGGIYCWGRRTYFLWGEFKDVATTDDALCAVTAGGTVRCYRWSEASWTDQEKWRLEEGSSPPVQDAQRVSGAGSNFCSLSNSGRVECWTGPVGSPLVPPAGAQAEFFDVGERFACLADHERKLHCFGDTLPLKLPEAPLTVKDLAVGENFVCVVDSGEKVRCFGKQFEFEGTEAKAVSAQFSTACTRSANGRATCQGKRRASFNGVSRIGVGSNDVCIVNGQGRLACQGRAGSWHAGAPPQYLPTPKGGGSREELQEFVSLFRKADLPLTFGKGGDNPMGDPLPEKFGKLLGQSATKYWIGVRFELAGGYQAVTLLEPSVPRIELHVFSASGKHVHRRVMAQLQTRHVVGSGAWRTGHPPLSGRSTETVVKEDGTIVTESREVLELTRLGGAKLRSLCSILAFEAVEKWGADGKFTLQGSQVTQSRDALDGCSHDSPFVEVEMADDIAWHILQKWKALRIKEIADRGKSAEIWIPMNSVHGSGDHYIARVLEQIKSSASCEYWDYVPFGSYTVGWSPKIQGDGRVAPQRRFGPGCCPEGACPHENQPNALQLALVDAVERKNAKVIAKWIHPVKRCEVRIHDGSYISEGKVTPGDSHMVFNGELRMALHGIFAGFGCDDEFKDGLARCGWGFSSDSWSTYWEMIDGKPYLTRYEYSGH